MLADLPHVPDIEWYLYNEYEYPDKMEDLDIHSVYMKPIKIKLIQGNQYTMTPQTL